MILLSAMLGCDFSPAEGDYSLRFIGMISSCSGTSSFPWYSLEGGEGFELSIVGGEPGEAFAFDTDGLGQIPCGLDERSFECFLSPAYRNDSYLDEVYIGGVWEDDKHGELWWTWLRECLSDDAQDCVNTGVEACGSTLHMGIESTG